MLMNYQLIDSLLNQLSDSAIIGTEVETYLLTMLKKEIKNLIGDHKITPPSKTAKQQLYQIQLTINGKRIRITGKTELALYRNIIKAYNSKALTVNDMYERWIASPEQSAISTETLRRKTYRYNKFFKNVIGDIPMTKLTFGDIENAILLAQSKGITVKDLTESLNPIRGLCRMALREGLITTNPMDLVVINRNRCIRSKLQSTRACDRIVSDAEMDIITNECNNRINNAHNVTSAYYGIQLLNLTGMRVGELVALRWEDIDFDNMTIFIHSREIRITHNRTYEYRVVEGTKGTRTNDISIVSRVIPITDEAISLFSEIKKFNLNHNLDSEFVFVSASGRLTINSINSAMNKICKKLNIQPKKSPHDIRRTVASRLYHNGSNLKMIQTYLGHANVDTTKSYIYDSSTTESYYNSIRMNI